MIQETQNLLQGYVTNEIHNHVAAIEFFHPQSNSMPGKLLEELAGEITKAGNNKDVHAVVLRSAGNRAFCAGASFDELVAIKNEEEGTRFFNGFAHVINAMRNCPKFILARIQGKCVGGGIGLAAAADYTFAVTGADIKLSELAIGIGPFVIGPAVERKIGLSSFAQLAIDANNWRSAAWAKEKGLYAELHPTLEDMDAAVKGLSETLASSNPEAMAEMKKMFWKGTEHWDELLPERAAISGRLVLSDFTKNAIAKFSNRTK